MSYRDRFKGYHLSDLYHFGKRIWIGPRGSYCYMNSKSNWVRLSKAQVDKYNYYDEVAADRYRAAHTKAAVNRIKKFR